VKPALAAALALLAWWLLTRLQPEVHGFDPDAAALRGVSDAEWEAFYAAMGLDRGDPWADVTDSLR
jgi:hypothetical protein